MRQPNRFSELITLTVPKKPPWRPEEEAEIEGDSEAEPEIRRYLALAAIALDSKPVARQRRKQRAATQIEFPRRAA
jgi:hypothetical protein